MRFVWVKVLNNLISLAENATEDRRLMWLRFVGSLLLLLIGEHWFEKKQNSSALCQKSKIKRILWNNGGISGIFLLLISIFSKDQWLFEAFFVCYNLLAILL